MYYQAIVGVFIFFIPPLSIACDLNSCTDIDDYRGARNSLTNTDFTCTTKPEGIQKQIATFVDSLNPNQNNQRHSDFIQCLKNTMEEVEQRRASDRQHIVSEINTLQLSQIPKETQMEMLNTLMSDDSFYSYFETKYKTGVGRIRNTYFTFTGPALEMNTTLKGEISQKGITKKVYEKSGIDVLNQKENPILFLMERMQSDQYHWEPSPQNQNFTPGMSKLILFELIRTFHHNNSRNSDNYMQAFNAFAEKIKLGVVIPDEEFADDLSNKARFQYTINDGYFFSAKLNNIRPQPDSLPMSLDCTSFFQLCAFGADSFEQTPNPLKIVTGDFIRAYEVNIGAKPAPYTRQSCPKCSCDSKYI